MKIAVLTSGGVDSSLALALLHEAGHDVTAFYLKIWLEDELDYLGQCPWQEDLEYVDALCDRLGIPLNVVPLQQEYNARVIAYTLEEARAGRTPNPDVLCNSWIKFGAFYDAIDPVFERVATGHYARVVADETRARLFTAPDRVKDQTYFLANLSQQQLARALFPIGHLDKAAVREEARRLALPAQDRKDSQGLCFLGKIRYRDFLEHHLGERAGQLIEWETGETIGEHKGFWFYTIGQRQGLGLSGGPWYVVEKDATNNKVYISRDYDSLAKRRSEFFLPAPDWIADEPDFSKQLRVKLRHGPEAYTCEVKRDRGGLIVQIEGRDQGIAPGQFAVFYDGEECLGGGRMERRMMVPPEGVLTR